MNPEAFEILGAIRDQETFAVGTRIRALARLVRTYGKGPWKKRKGFAKVRRNNLVFEAEIHWYEAKGTGRFEFRIKRVLHG